MATPQLRRYAALTAKAPTARATFNIYVEDGKLTYVKAPCSRSDTQAPFFLHVVPEDIDNLPDARHPYGFENLDFHWNSFDSIFKGASSTVCMATRKLPYAIANIATGQVLAGDDLWRTHIPEDRSVVPDAPTAPQLRQRYAALTANAPTASATFDLYAEEGKLTYVKAPCSQSDTQAPFFLHVVPADINDLPDARHPHGFENLDFRWDALFGSTFEGVSSTVCMATRELPRYPIADVATGQALAGEPDLWRTHIPEALLSRRPAVSQVRQRHAALTANEPTARATFDLYVEGDKLTYVKAPCTKSDTQAPFFLHVAPEDIDDLPDARHPHGFENLDFRWGAPLDSIFEQDSSTVCMATRKLPGYAIANIATGQALAGEPNLWRTRIRCSAWWRTSNQCR